MVGFVGSPAGLCPYGQTNHPEPSQTSDHSQQPLEPAGGRFNSPAPDGKRRSIRLGKVSQRQAEAVKVKVEQLAAAAISGHAVDDETARWVAKLDQTMANKLAHVGLIPRQPEAKQATLQAFLDSYIAGRTDAKPNTLIVWRQTRRCLIEYFGADRPLRNITPGDADAWRLWLLAEGLAENTVRRRCGFAKQFFRAAVRRRLIAENPFADIQGTTVKGNRERDYFVTREEAEKVLDACPDSQWRLLFALSRYAGLRCPSEHLALRRWGNVDWERGRIHVRSPKREHHASREARVIPLFPELRPYLEAVFDEAEPGTEYVITRYRNRNANLRKQLLRIIHPARPECACDRLNPT